MKQFFILLIILSVFIIRCSDESSNGNEQSQVSAELTEDNQMPEEEESFLHETEVETNVVKNEEKSKAVVKENKATEIKTNELKNIAETNETKANENTEIETVTETVNENKIEDIEKVVYIAKTGKKYHLENCRTL